MGGIAFLIVLVAVAGFVMSAYTGLIALKGDTVNAWKQIDVQLKRRHDLIPNLVNAVKGAMDFERQTLEAVIQARVSKIEALAVQVAEHSAVAAEQIRALARDFRYDTLASALQSAMAS